MQAAKNRRWDFVRRARPFPCPEIVGPFRLITAHDQCCESDWQRPYGTVTGRANRTRFVPDDIEIALLAFTEQGNSSANDAACTDGYRYRLYYASSTIFCSVVGPCAVLTEQCSAPHVYYVSIKVRLRRCLQISYQWEKRWLVRSSKSSLSQG